jgi:leader peptidase (prepilin peptidase)/N-methyltransferase
VIETNILKGILVFAIGSLLGSFLNVLIYRLPREKSIVWPGSKCPKCNTPIAGYDNIPVLSWLILSGKCRHCKEKISIRYPLVELLTATLLFLTYKNFGINENWFLLTYFVCLMIVISLIDIDHMLILNSLTYPGIIIGFIYSYANNNIQQSLLGAFLGAVFFYLIVKISFFIMKKEGLGMGDVTFVALMGAWLGINYLLGALLISFFLGSLIGIMLLIKRGKSDYFPFGPSLAAGALVTLLTNNFLLTWYMDKFL